MRAALCFLLGMAVAAISFSQEFKGVSYKKPAAWDEATEGDAKIFTPKGLKEGELLAIIMTGAVPSNGSSWEKQFADTIALANDGGKASEASEVQKRTTTGVTLLLQTLKLDHKTIGKHGRLYAQVSKGEQRTFITVLVGKEELLNQHGEAITEFLGNLGFKEAASSGSAARIPTGNTPDLFPGSVGWLPSGRGVPIPAAAISNGKPLGLWWKFVYDASARRTKAVVHIYLADGTRASNPRLGGGMLFDAEGQRGQKGNTGVGTFAIANGQIVERYDGFVNKSAFAIGSDSVGKLFKIGGAAFHPLMPVTGQSLLGQWKGPGLEYKFKADGTYQTGLAQSNGDWAVTGFNTGTYVLDGYLIMLMPKGAPSFVSILGRAGEQLILGDTFYEKR